ncbi:MAG TPA: response regulator [Propionibacteriaceae bacterium]|nr:response regulator [Propionibacteriaceae bacterium]
MTSFAFEPVGTQLSEEAAGISGLAAAPAKPQAEAATTTLRLLHVEDNPADALLMQEYIRGILPSVTFDTADRLSDVSAERVRAVDCALLDLSLPDASGLDALLALRRMSEDLPIIVLTGFDNMELGLSAVRDGADDYLIKNHVDGFTLERAVQYSIERRRLMLQVAKSTAQAIVATATSITAEAATEEALRGADDGESEAKAAPGTHEVAVRIDRDSQEFVLSCQSCGWESDRGTDGMHSWSARDLEVTLLHHIDFEGAARRQRRERPQASSVQQERSTIGRRSVLRPRDWVS